jgi:hypothetical protein
MGDWIGVTNPFRQLELLDDRIDPEFKVFNQRI